MGTRSGPYYADESWKKEKGETRLHYTGPERKKEEFRVQIVVGPTPTWQGFQTCTYVGRYLRLREGWMFNFPRTRVKNPKTDSTRLESQIHPSILSSELVSIRKACSCTAWDPRRTEESDHRIGHSSFSPFSLIYIHPSTVNVVPPSLGAAFSSCEMLDWWLKEKKERKKIGIRRKSHSTLFSLFLFFDKLKRMDRWMANNF